MSRFVHFGLAGAAALAALVLAGAASAAPNTGSIVVSYTPMISGSSTSATIEVSTPQTTDPIAAVTIFTGTEFVNGGGAPGTQIGTVDATAFAHDANLNLPLSGPVTTDDPAKHTADPCSPGTNQAVWNMNLSAAGSTLVIPIYVNKTTGATAGLGPYTLKICLPPWDVPVGTPGRSFEGAQLLNAKLTLNKIFTAPSSAGLGKWDALFTPYNPGRGTPNPAGTFEARAFVPLPISLSVKKTYNKKTNTWRLSGKITEGGLPVIETTLLVIHRGTSPSALKYRSTTKVKADGTWSTAGHLNPKKTTYFQISVAKAVRSYTATGCQSPYTAFAPAGCVDASLSAWSAQSAIIKIAR